MSDDHIRFDDESAIHSAMDPEPTRRAIRRAKRIGRYSMLFFGVLTLAALTSWLWHRSDMMASDRASTIELAKRAVSDVDGALIEARQVGEQIVAHVAAVDAENRDEIENWLGQLLRSHGLLKQVGFALDPSVTRDGKRYGPFCKRFGGNVVCETLEGVDEGTYDYTKDVPETQWYHRTKEHGAGWSDPYFDPPTQANLAEFTAPVALRSAPRRFGGTAFANYSLNTLTDLVKTADLGRGGYAFIMTRQGRIVSHPNYAYVSRGRPDDPTFGSLAQDSGNSAFIEMADILAADATATPSNIEGPDPMTGQQAFFDCGELAEPGWLLCSITIAEGTASARRASARRLIHLGLALIGLILSALMLVPGAVRQERRYLWLNSTMAAATLFAGVGGVWALVHQGSLGDPEHEIVIAGSQVDQQLDAATIDVRKSDLPTNVAVPVPTGIFVERAEISGHAQINANFVVWQRAPIDWAGLPGSEVPEWFGVELPASIETFANDVIYDTEVEGERVVGWRVQANMMQWFDTSRFPFDHTTLMFDLQPQSKDSAVVLVPDLSAYRAIVPSAAPGVSKELRLAGWTVGEAYFTFIDPEPGTTFGLGEAAYADEMKTMRYEIGIQRQLVNAFVTHVLSVAIVLFLMFLVLLLTTNRAGRIERFGFDASTAIGAYGTFFFIAVLEHVALREDVAIGQLVYFEWFYIIVYMGLLLLSIDALLLASGKPIRFIQARDNLWPKVLFWPTTAAALLGVTLMTFY